MIGSIKLFIAPITGDTMPESPIYRAALAILQYFAENPTATDTAEGIACWWVEEDTETVEKALALLEKEGVVVREGDRFFLAFALPHKKRYQRLQYKPGKSEK